MRDVLRMLAIAWAVTAVLFLFSWVGYKAAQYDLPVQVEYRYVPEPCGGASPVIPEMAQ